mgnify:CR=1 FL=1
MKSRTASPGLLEGCGLPAARAHGAAWSRWPAAAATRPSIGSSTPRRKTFVEDGFSLPEAKSGVVVARRGTRCGSAPTSGRDRRQPPAIRGLVKLWKRGTPLAQARPCSRVVERRGRSAVHPVHARRALRLRQPHAGVLPAGDLPRPRGSAREDRRAGRRGPRGHLQDRMLRLAAHRLERRREDLPARQPARHRTRSVPARRGGSSRSCSNRQSRSRCRASSQTRDSILITTLDNVRGKLTALTRVRTAGLARTIALPGLGTVRVASTDDDWQVGVLLSIRRTSSPPRRSS